MTQIISGLSDENQSLNVCIIMKDNKLKGVYFIQRNYLLKNNYYTGKNVWKLECLYNASETINQKLFREKFVITKNLKMCIAHNLTISFLGLYSREALPHGHKKIWCLLQHCE